MRNHKDIRRISTVFLVAVLLTGSGCEAENEPVVEDTAMVPDRPEMVRPLLPGMKAAPFSLTAADGSQYEFSPDALDRPVVLIFYRGGWCPYCTRHLASLRNVESEIIEMGYDVLFVSADRYEVIRESLQVEGVEYTLLADNHLTAARDYGIAFRLDDATAERYISGGADIEHASGETHHWLPVPAVFIVGRDGIIRFQYVNPNYRVRIQPELLVTAASLAIADDA